MGQFRINGATLNCDDPIVHYGGRDVLGYQGGRLVYGAYETYTLSWSYMLNAAANDLVSRINALAGARVSLTLPTPGSGAAWATKYGNLRVAAWARDYANGVDAVAVEVTRVSNSA